MTVKGERPAQLFRLAELVERFGGSCNAGSDIHVSRFAPLDEAQEGELAFLSNSKLRDQALRSGASAVLVTARDAEWIAAECAQDIPALWVTANPYAQFARIAQFFEAAQAPAQRPGIAAGAHVDTSARVAASAIVEPGCVIGAQVEIGEHAHIGAGSIIGAGTCIGADTRLHARVTIYADCVIGERGIIHSGVVVGADGFGFARDGAEWVKIPQTGRVVIGNDVEIGANTTIDRGALADTVIGNGVKLDNQIQIAHNVRIGDYCAMAGCVGVAGSTVFGKRCTIGGAAVIIGHLVLADDVHISAATVVTKSIHKAGQYTGVYPFADHASWEKNAAVLRQVGSLRERLRVLERMLAQHETSGSP